MQTLKGYQTGKHLEAFILLVIAQSPLYGGAVIARLKEILPSRWTIDDGQVYRLLRQLESNGAVTSQWVVENAGSPVRVYRLTELGYQRLVFWKEDITLRVRSLQQFLELWATLPEADDPKSR